MADVAAASEKAVLQGSKWQDAAVTVVKPDPRQSQDGRFAEKRIAGGTSAQEQKANRQLACAR